MPLVSHTAARLPQKALSLHIASDGEGRFVLYRDAQ